MFKAQFPLHESFLEFHDVRVDLRPDTRSFVATIPVAYLSWRFVEVPFRFGRSFDRSFVFLSSAVMTSLFAVYGYYLVWTRGIPARLYPDSAWTREERHIAYNERAFRFRKTSFGQRDALKILVVGNSFARDFINMTVETFDLRGIDIAYRDDPGECVSSWPPSEAGLLLEDADVIVFASRYFDPACVSGNLDFARSHGKELFYIGTKHFGTNMNWIARLGPDERRDRLNPLPGNVLAQEDLMSRTIPREHYVSLLAAVVRDEKIPITDAEGRLISADRTHLTQAGARFMGRRALLDSPYGNLLRAVRGAQD